MNHPATHENNPQQRSFYPAAILFSAIPFPATHPPLRPFKNKLPEMFSHSEHFFTRGNDFAFGEEEAMIAGVAKFDAEGVTDFTLRVGPIYCRAAIDNTSLKSGTGKEEGG